MILKIDAFMQISELKNAYANEIVRVWKNGGNLSAYESTAGCIDECNELFKLTRIAEPDEDVSEVLRRRQVVLQTRIDTVIRKSRVETDEDLVVNLVHALQMLLAEREVIEDVVIRANYTQKATTGQTVMATQQKI